MLPRCACCCPGLHQLVVDSSVHVALLQILNAKDVPDLTKEAVFHIEKTLEGLIITEVYSKRAGGNAEASARGDAGTSSSAAAAREAMDSGSDGGAALSTGEAAGARTSSRSGRPLRGFNGNSSSVDNPDYE